MYVEEPPVSGWPISLCLECRFFVNHCYQKQNINTPVYLYPHSNKLFYHAVMFISRQEISKVALILERIHPSFPRRIVHST